MKRLLPVFRGIGAYSGSARNIEEESQALQEADSDDPAAWLEARRFDGAVRAAVEEQAASIWSAMNSPETGFDICGQSHIDVAWKWRYFQALRKAILTYRKAVWHVRNHRSYCFAASQPALLEWIQTEDPALFDEIKSAVKTGRFDLVGGMWVEPDCRLPSGESLIRQRLYGQLFYLRHFGRTSDVEWLPDSFGFASTLPQIILKSGSRYFYTIKLHSNDTTRFPFRQFLWQSPDGSRVLARINADPGEARDERTPTRGRGRLLKHGEALTADYTDDRPEEADVFSDETPEACLFMGEGDGGHGPTGREVAVADHLVATRPVRWTSATRCFQTRLERHRNRLPVWNDELYYEFHRGTLTTQDLVKRMNRYFEWRLCSVEALLTIGLLLTDGEATAWREKMERVWKLTLLNQFHDVLPGSSIPEVFDDCYDLWEVARTDLDEVESQAWRMLASPRTIADSAAGELIVFNGTGLDVENAPIEVPLEAGQTPTGMIVDGESCSFQIMEADGFGLDPRFVARPRRVLFSISMPQHSFTSIRLSGSVRANPGSTVAASAVGDAITLESDRYRVRVSRTTGDIDSLFFKAIQKEVLAAPGIGVNAFYDWLPDEQCWNILPGYRHRKLSLPPPSSVEIVGDGPVRRTIQISRRIANTQSTSDANADSLMLERVSIDAESPGVHLDFLMDWHTCECVVKCDVHTATCAESVVAEVPDGTITRLTRPTASHDRPRWENYHQSWVDLPSIDGRWGIGIVNNGKYGYDAVGGRIGLTMIRGPRYPLPSAESWVQQERVERFKRTGGTVPTHADMGTHLIQYVLLPHRGDWAHSDPCLPAFAHWLNHGYLAVISRHALIDGIVGRRLIWCDSNRAELTTAKPAEAGSGFLIRLVEAKREHGAVTVSLDSRLGVRSVEETDLLERPLDDAQISTVRQPDGSLASFSVELRPHQIRSFLLRRGTAP